MPRMPGDAVNGFASTISGGVFVVGLVLELCLPKDPKRYEIR